MLACLMASLYCSSLWCFPLFTHPVGYCLLLLLSSASGMVLSYMTLGFSWYIILFSLVYLGGVYVLFIFVSFINPNSASSSGFTFTGFFLVWIFCSALLWLLDTSSLVMVENSDCLCSYHDGLTYCVFCLVLMIGFYIISVVSSCKASFYR